jgi:hypothetical protein
MIPDPLCCENLTKKRADPRSGKLIPDLVGLKIGSRIRILNLGNKNWKKYSLLYFILHFIATGSRAGVVSEPGSTKIINKWINFYGSNPATDPLSLENSKFLLHFLIPGSAIQIPNPALDPLSHCIRIQRGPRSKFTTLGQLGDSLLLVFFFMPLSYSCFLSLELTSCPNKNTIFRMQNLNSIK